MFTVLSLYSSTTKSYGLGPSILNCQLYIPVVNRFKDFLGYVPAGELIGLWELKGIIIILRIYTKYAHCPVKKYLIGWIIA